MEGTAHRHHASRKRLFELCSGGGLPPDGHRVSRRSRVPGEGGKAVKLPSGPRVNGGPKARRVALLAKWSKVRAASASLLPACCLPGLPGLPCKDGGEQHPFIRLPRSEPPLKTAVAFKFLSRPLYTLALLRASAACLPTRSKTPVFIFLRERGGGLNFIYVSIPRTKKKQKTENIPVDRFWRR